MIPAIKITVSSKVQSAMRRLIAARKFESQRRNLETVVAFVLSEVKKHTPGERLFRGWTSEIKVEHDGDGDWKMSARIFNTMLKERLWYDAAISGERKPKLKTYPSNDQQTYGDVLPFLDKGTRPHEITPKRYPNLVFRTSAVPGPGSPDRSNLVITKHVSHPGTRRYGTLSVPRAKLKVLMKSTVVEQKEQIIRAW